MQRGALSHDERMELNRHLRVCDSCQQAYAEYALISTEGMPFLAAAYGHGDESDDWDDGPVRNRLLARVRCEAGELGQVDRPHTSARVLQMGRSFHPGREAVRWAGLAIAACVLVAVGAYRLGSRSRGCRAKFHRFIRSHFRCSLRQKGSRRFSCKADRADIPSAASGFGQSTGSGPTAGGPARCGNAFRHNVGCESSTRRRIPSRIGTAGPTSQPTSRCRTELSTGAGRTDDATHGTRSPSVAYNFITIEGGGSYRFLP